MVARGLSERRALAVGRNERVSASAFRYVPRPDGNAVVRDRIVDLAQRHRRYGAGMIYLKLRQAGHVINHTHTRGAEGAWRTGVELSSTRRAQDNGRHGLLSGRSRSLRSLGGDRVDRLYTEARWPCRPRRAARCSWRPACWPLSRLEAPSTQEDPDSRPPAPGAPRASQPGLVRGLRLRSHGGWAGYEVPDHCRRRHP